MEYERILALLRELERRKVDYILVGAVAMTILGIVRATEDIDFFLPRNEENLRCFKEALRAVWNDPEIDAIRPEDLAANYGVIRYGPPNERLTIDVITRLGTAFQYEDLAAQNVKWEGIQVRVATPETLYRMKKDTLRLQDKADAARLRENFDLSEE